MTEIPAHGDAPEVRASDDERDQTLALLQRHFAEGRLTPAELDERIADTIEARTRDQLRALTADLPSDSDAPSLRAVGTDWRIFTVLVLICPPAALAYWLLSRNY